MKPILMSVFLVSSALVSHQVLADCKEIVDSTVAEMRAGAVQWNAELERLARAAAGSACVKATSDSKATVAPAAHSQQPVVQMQEQAVHADTPAAAKTGGPKSESSAAAESADSDWSPLKGFKFNKVTGSPGRKPYERRREVFDTEEGEEQDGEEENP